jgi:prepilin-type N-terminal cleavage/methylation domain-containing protein
MTRDAGYAIGKPARGRMPRRAFTLIELMIAIALSTVIILIAVSAFRQAAHAMSLMNRLSLENGMIRTGYFLSADDCDYWNSQANPEYPYLKGYMSDQIEIAGDKGNNIYNKRPFREVAFRSSVLPAASGGVADPNFDPNWDLPHDGRSWYRNYVLPSYRGWRPDLSTGSETTGYVYWPTFNDSSSFSNWWGGPPLGSIGTRYGTPNWEACTRSGAGWMWSGGNTVTLPVGWGDLWHIWGDYSVLSNIGDVRKVGHPGPDDAPASADGTGPDGYPRVDGDPLNADSIACRGARPKLMFRLFRELGHIGVYTYMPPGTLNLIAAPSFNNIATNIGVADTHWCKGEIPWQLNRPTVKKTVLSVAAWWLGNPKLQQWELPTAVVAPTAVDDPRNSTGAYHMGMPGPGAKMFNFDLLPPTEDHGSIMPDYAADLELCNGDLFFETEGNSYNGWQRRQATASIGMVLGHKMTPKDMSGLTFDSKPLIDQALIDPFRCVYRDTETADWLLNGFADERHLNTFESNSRIVGIFRQMRDYGSETVRVPSTYTDDPNPDFDAKPKDVPSLLTTSTRFRLKGSDKAIFTVKMVDPEGHVVQMGFTMVGSTLRGARQHWGWKTHYDRPGMKKMGDIYAAP